VPAVRSPVSHPRLPCAPDTRPSSVPDYRTRRSTTGSRFPVACPVPVLVLGRYPEPSLPCLAITISAGWIFEARVHQIFQRGGPFKATKLGGSTTITIDIDHKSCKDFSNVTELGSLLRKQPGSQSINPDIIGGYFKPQRCNRCLVDSFAITRFATTDKPVLVLFRMTLSTSHPVKAEELACIWAEVPEELWETPPYSFLSFRPMSQIRFQSKL
jgi:hypothetical protein